jgi:hypothetical protein
MTLACLMFHSYAFVEGTFIGVFLASTHKRFMLTGGLHPRLTLGRILTRAGMPCQPAVSGGLGRFGGFWAGGGCPPTSPFGLRRTSRRQGVLAGGQYPFEFIICPSVQVTCDGVRPQLLSHGCWHAYIPVPAYSHIKPGMQELKYEHISPSSSTPSGAQAYGATPLGGRTL